MGSFSDITIGEYMGFEQKNTYSEDIINAIFLPSDYIEKTLYDQEDSYIQKGFESTVGISLKRLEIFGGTLELDKDMYDNEIKHSIVRYDDMSFEEYTDFIRECIYSGKGKYELEKEFIGHKRFLIASDFNIGQSVYFWLYALFCKLKPETKIFYNITNFITGRLERSDLDEILDFEKITILTEGVTDSNFIKESLRILEPEIADYYKFIDNKKYNIRGGAANIVHTVRSFVGSNIDNKVIALFDNDTAGIKELNILNRITLPYNIKAFHYPDISLANSYPTIGPTGNEKLNINGLACSIELYLGKDVLQDDDKSFYPVKWKGDQTSDNNYQGVILNKSIIQDRFKAKIRRSNIVELGDWDEMKEIINLIKSAWN